MTPKKTARSSQGPLPLDGYIRVSQVGGRGGEGFISPEVQEQSILDWAKRNRREVVLQPRELNVSGGTMDRPVFNRLMQRVRDGESGGIVVFKSDRFARSLLGAVVTLAELGQHGAAFASATEPQLDYSTPAGQAFLHMLFVFAEFVRATIKESWATSQRMAVERGIHISPYDYLGYDTGEDGRLAPNDWAPTAKEVFERRGRRQGWGTIATWLNECGAPVPVSKKKGGKRRAAVQWNANMVQRMCAKRVYRGEASRYVTQNVDDREPILNREAHLALVSEELWRSAQMASTAATGQNLKPSQLLSGLVRCGGCRYRMSKGEGPGGEALYRCRGKHASGECPERASIKVEALDAYVDAVMAAELDTPADLIPDTVSREDALRVLTSARSDLDDFRCDTAARKKLGNAWHEWLDVYLKSVQEAEIALGRIDELAGVSGTEGLASDHYLSLPTDERREVLGGFLDAVIVRRSRGKGRHVDPTPERTRILWRGEGPADLPRPRVVNDIRRFDFGESDIESGVVAT